jgi:hypothetical protein
LILPFNGPMREKGDKQALEDLVVDVSLWEVRGGGFKSGGIIQKVFGSCGCFLCVYGSTRERHNTKPRDNQAY